MNIVPATSLGFLAFAPEYEERNWKIDERHRTWNHFQWCDQDTLFESFTE